MFSRAPLKNSGGLTSGFYRDCRKLLKMKYFFTFLFVLRPIFAAVVPKIKPEVLARTDVRASCVS